MDISPISMPQRCISYDFIEKKSAMKTNWLEYFSERLSKDLSFLSLLAVFLVITQPLH